MDTATVLVGFAELAIALAGFTTIATVIVRVSDSTSENLLAVRLKMVLMFSVHLIVVSLAPVAFYEIEPGADRIWHWSAITSFFSAAVVAFIGFFHILPRVIRDPKKSWWQTISSILLGSASVVTGVLTITGGKPVFWYTVTLAFILGTCLTMLIGLVLSFPVFDTHRKQLLAKAYLRHQLKVLV